MIFVNSMSDLFHDEVPLSYISRVAATMRLARWHTYQVLTKRSERLRRCCADHYGKPRKRPISGGACPSRTESTDFRE